MLHMGHNYQTGIEGDEVGITPSWTAREAGGFVVGYKGVII